MCIGVTIPLSIGSKSGSRIPKKLKIRLRNRTLLPSSRRLAANRAPPRRLLALVCQNAALAHEQRHSARLGEFPHRFTEPIQRWGRVARQQKRGRGGDFKYIYGARGSKRGRQQIPTRRNAASFRCRCVVFEILVKGVVNFVFGNGARDLQI